MKKMIRLIYVFQLAFLMIIGPVLFYQNRYINMFYQNISYINVSVPDQKAFNAFLSWTKSHNITVSRLVEHSDHEIVLHLCDWAIKEHISLSEGNYPIENQFVSDQITKNSKQSGIIKKILPDYSFKIYVLSEPDEVNLYNLYIISSTDKSEINEMISDLEKQHVTIQPEDICDYNSLALLLCSLPKAVVLLGLIFVCYSFILTFALLKQFIKKELEISHKQSFEDACRHDNYRTFIAKLLWDKTWLLITIGVYAILCSMFFLKKELQPFYIQISILYFIGSIFITSIYIVFSCMIIFILNCMFKREKNTINQNKRKSGTLRITNYLHKFACVFFILISVSILIQLSDSFLQETINLSSWKNTNNLYRVEMKYVGQDDDITIEVELDKKISDLYQKLTKDNDAFFMDDNNINTMEFFGVNYPLTGLVTDGFATHITVSPNYFHMNPIVTIKGNPVERELVFSDYTLNILVPEAYSSLHDEICDYFLEYFDYNRYQIYESIYKDVPNETWTPSTNEPLKVNLIYVKNNQQYFTYSADTRKKEGNMIQDPVVVVYTDNFHPNYILNTASRCLYFKYDENQMKSVDEYLAENIGMEDFLDATSIQKEHMKQVSKSRNSFFISVFVIAFLLFGYTVIDARIYQNLFEQKYVENKEKGFENIQKGFFFIVMKQLILMLLSSVLFILLGKKLFIRFLTTISYPSIAVVLAILILLDIIVCVMNKRVNTAIGAIISK